MPKIPRSILKSFFEKGDKPTQAQFAALLDSTANLLDDKELLGLREYLTTRSYSSGETAVHLGNVYICLGDTSGAFDPAKWKNLVTLGSVYYAGTWDAAANFPALASSVGTKGEYYVVSNSGTTNLNGITDWKTSDWVIYNGAAWEKVDNTDNMTAVNVSFTPNGSIAATNVQDAIVELRDDTDSLLGDKADKVTGATSGNIATLTAAGNSSDSGFTLTDFLSKINTIPYDPTLQYHPATKKYVDDAITGIDMSGKADKVVGATDGHFASLDATGNLTDSGKSAADYLAKNNADVYTPVDDYNPSTKKYVDDAVSGIDLSVKADKVSGAVNGHFASLDAAGNLADSGASAADYLAKNNAAVFTPAGDYNPSTKKYVDDAITGINISGKADKVTGTVDGHLAALDASGNLTDSGKSTSDYLAKNNADFFVPTGDYNPSTKKYVDDAIAGINISDKADKVTGAVNGHFAALDASGNLTDSGKSPADYLAKNNTMAFVPGGDYNPATKKYVDDGLSGKQNADATLTALAGLATGADYVPYSTGTDTFSQTALTTYARSLIDDSDAAAARTTLGLGDAATRNVGTTSGTVADGGDARFTDARRRKMVDSATFSYNAAAAAGTEELAYTLHVSAGEVTAGCFMQLKFLCTAGSNGSNKIFRLYVNSSNSLSGATLAGNFTARQNNRSFIFSREFAVRSSVSIIGAGLSTTDIPGNDTGIVNDTPAAITVPNLGQEHYWLLSIERSTPLTTASIEFGKLNIDKL